MLYRLSPHSPLEWTDFPGWSLFDTLLEHGADLDRLDWKPTEDRQFSIDLLRIALRHGEPSRSGIVLDARHTLDLGRSDELRLNQHRMDELQAEIRAKNGPMMEALIPGWTASGRELDERVRESTERVAQEADADLAKVLETPVRHDLVAHWRGLGGQTPDGDDD